MTIRFKADQIHVESTEQHTLIGFAEKKDSQFEYLVSLRKFEQADPERVQFSNDSVFLEYSNAEVCGYGCIQSCNLTASCMVLLLDGNKCPALPDHEIVVEFHSEDHRLEDLEIILTQLLADELVLNTILQ